MSDYHLTNPNLAFHESHLTSIPLPSDLLRHQLLFLHNLQLSWDVFPLTFTNILLLTCKLISTCCSFSLSQPIFSVLAGWHSFTNCSPLVVIQFHFSNTVPYSFLPINLLYLSFSLPLPPTLTPDRNLPQQLPVPASVPPFSSCSKRKCTPEQNWAGTCST